jgi:hypothetical protein
VDLLGRGACTGFFGVDVHGLRAWWGIGGVGCGGCWLGTGGLSAEAASVSQMLESSAAAGKFVFVWYRTWTRSTTRVVAQ